MECPICNQRPVFSWTDTHGVAQCGTCGAPWLIYHYEGEGAESKRVDKPPELIVRPEYVQPLRDYRAQTGRMIPSGHSFPGSNQELASDGDQRAFNAWMAANGPNVF